MTSTLLVFPLRLPDDLRKWIQREAKRNLRPMTSEIIIAIRERMERESLPLKRNK